MYLEENRDLNPITETQINWAEKLAGDYRKTSEILLGIVKEAKKLNYFTSKMRQVIRVHSDAVKYAVNQYKQEGK